MIIPRSSPYTFFIVVKYFLKTCFNPNCEFKRNEIEQKRRKIQPTEIGW